MINMGPMFRLRKYGQIDLHYVVSFLGLSIHPAFHILQQVDPFSVDFSFTCEGILGTKLGPSLIPGSPLAPTKIFFIGGEGRALE